MPNCRGWKGGAGVGGGGQIANFWQKKPQVHLIIIRE